MKKQFQIKSFKSLQQEKPEHLQKSKSLAYIKKSSLITSEYDKLFQKPSEQIAEEYLTNPFMKARVDSFIKTKQKQCQQMEKSHRINKKIIDGQNQQNQVTLRQLLSKKILQEKSVVDELKNQITRLKMKMKTNKNYKVKN